MTLGTAPRSTVRTRYDESNWPFVIITLPPRELTEDEFRDNLRRMDEYGARGGKFGFVLDTRGAPDPEAPRRRAIAEYWDACLGRHGDTFVGAAIVMSSSTGRAVFKAILWLRQNPQRLIPVASTEEGLQRLRALAPGA
ncbi:MAG TPA: hypothetical protein VHP33_17300 [Polyangiaceae bacterium]|nr:hypothetical protein [Polyangiaceae bacterium]